MLALGILSPLSRAFLVGARRNKDQSHPVSGPVASLIGSRCLPASCLGHHLGPHLQYQLLRVIGSLALICHSFVQRASLPTALGVWPDILSRYINRSFANPRSLAFPCFSNHVSSASSCKPCPLTPAPDTATASFAVPDVSQRLRGDYEPEVTAFISWV